MIHPVNRRQNTPYKWISPISEPLRGTKKQPHRISPVGVSVRITGSGQRKSMKKERR